MKKKIFFFLSFLKEKKKMTEFIPMLSSTFLAGAFAVANSALAINLHQHYGKIYNKGDVTCLNPDPTDGNCTLGGPYGNALLAITIATLIFNGMMVFLFLWKWIQVKFTENRIAVNTVLTLTTLSILVATAQASYTLYIQQNFGKEMHKGHMGTNCVAANGFANCESLGGKAGDWLMGLSIASVSLSGLGLLFYTGQMFGKPLEMLQPFLKGLDSSEKRKKKDESYFTD